jgi:hypothetical protein
VLLQRENATKRKVKVEIRLTMEEAKKFHVLEELGIRMIYLGSPQAKGRIERLWRILDR